MFKVSGVSETGNPLIMQKIIFQGLFWKNSTPQGFLEISKNSEHHRVPKAGPVQMGQYFGWASKPEDESSQSWAY